MCRGGAGWAVSRHCPALLAALWVVVAALQEWRSWEEVPPFRSPPARRETHTYSYYRPTFGLRGEALTSALTMSTLFEAAPRVVGGAWSGGEWGVEVDDVAADEWSFRIAKG